MHYPVSFVSLGGGTNIYYINKPSKQNEKIFGLPASLYKETIKHNIDAV